MIMRPYAADVTMFDAVDFDDVADALFSLLIIRAIHDAAIF